MLGASRTSFLPDVKHQFRAPAQAALSTTFRSAPLDLARLVGFWNTNEWGVARALLFAVNVESVNVAGGRTYPFTLEVDDNVNFTSAVVVDTVTLGAGFASGTFDLNVTREALAALDSAAKFVRLVCAPTGTAESGQIAFSAVADAGDTVTIFDGVNTTIFTFAASGNGATGAAVNVAVGVTATDSAQNLKTAINNNLNLVGVASTGAAATIAITHQWAGGSITKSDADNDYAVTNFTGGVAPSIAFWSYVRGKQGVC